MQAEQKLKIISLPILKFIKSMPSIFKTDSRKARAVAKALQSRRSEKQLPSRQGKGADHSATGQYHTWTFVNSSYKAKTGETRNQADSCLISASHAQQESKDTGCETSNTIRSKSVVNLVDSVDLTEE